MADDDGGARAMAPAPVGKLRSVAPPPEGPGHRCVTDAALPPSPAEIAAGLSPAMRRALRRRQLDMLDGTATVSGHGMTMRALRKRAVVAGAMPHAHLTPLGRFVVSAANVDAEEGADA